MTAAPSCAHYYTTTTSASLNPVLFPLVKSQVTAALMWPALFLFRLYKLSVCAFVYLGNIFLSLYPFWAGWLVKKLQKNWKILIKFMTKLCICSFYNREVGNILLCASKTDFKNIFWPKPNMWSWLIRDSLELNKQTFKSWKPFKKTSIILMFVVILISTICWFFTPFAYVNLNYFKVD